MTVKTYPDQLLLIAVNVWGYSVVLKAEGEGAEQQCKDYSFFPEDLFESKTRIPQEPGFYLWRGELYIDDGQMPASEAVDPDIRWTGEFTKANIHALREFEIGNKLEALSGRKDAARSDQNSSTR